MSINETITALKNKYQLKVQFQPFPGDSFRFKPDNFCYYQGNYYFSFHREKKVVVYNLDLSPIHEITFQHSPKGIYIHQDILYVLFPEEKYLGVFTIIHNTVTPVTRVLFPETTPHYILGEMNRLWLTHEVGVSSFKSFGSFLGIYENQALQIVYDGIKTRMIGASFPGDNGLYLVDGLTHEILHCEKSGHLATATIHLPAHSHGSFYATGFAANGFFYLIDTGSILTKWDADGQLVFRYDLNQTGQLIHTGGMWHPFLSTPDGYVTMDLKNNGLVHIFV